MDLDDGGRVVDGGDGDRNRLLGRATPPIRVALSYSVKAGAAPAHGTVSFNQAAGTFIYTPKANVNGSDSFTIVVYDAREDVFYVGGSFSSNIWKVDRSGAILSTIDILAGFRNPVSSTKVHVKDLELAPSSDPNDNPSTLSLYVADYGNSHVDDGRLFEINLGDLVLV